MCRWRMVGCVLLGMVAWVGMKKLTSEVEEDGVQLRSGCNEFGGSSRPKLAGEMQGQG